MQFLHFQLLGRLRDLALLLDNAPQRRLVPLVPIRLLPLCVHPQVPLNVLLDGDPAVVYVHTRAEDVNSPKDAAILLQNQAFCLILMARGRCPCMAPGAPRGQRLVCCYIYGIAAGVFRERPATQQCASRVFRAIRAASLS